MNYQSKFYSYLMALITIILCSVFFSCCFASQVRYKYEAYVTWVQDGDSVTVVDNKGFEHKLHLYAIDAPELEQNAGQESYQNLVKLLPERALVWVEVENKDRYGREVATVYRSNDNVNRRQIADGYAWHYRRYDRIFIREYSSLEQQARKQRLGLWYYSNPMPPWDYRRTQKYGLVK